MEGWSQFICHDHLKNGPGSGVLENGWLKHMSISFVAIYIFPSLIVCVCLGERLMFFNPTSSLPEPGAH